MSLASIKLQLPKNLTAARERIEKAMGVPVPAMWQEGETFIAAEQPDAIGAALIGQLHRHLVNARIAHLFREQLPHAWAKATRAGGKLAFLAEVDFTIEYDLTVWTRLSAEQRVALVDHELCHCGADENDRWVLIEHDVEEFAGIVHRWGLWRPTLRNFKGAMDLAQVELSFNEPQAPA